MCICTWSLAAGQSARSWGVVSSGHTQINQLTRQRTIDVLLDASEVDGLDSSHLLLGDSCHSAGGGPGGGIDGGHKGSASRGAELLDQGRADGSGEGAGRHCAEGLRRGEGEWSGEWFCYGRR